MRTVIRARLSSYLGNKVRAIITDTITYAFIVLFIYTATSKIFDFREFSNGLYVVPVLGTYRFVVAALIISSQLIIGALLIVPVTQKIGLFGSLLLLFIFTIYLIYMVSFADVLPCSCGGISSYLSWKAQIWCNAVLVILAGFGILTNQ